MAKNTKKAKKAKKTEVPQAVIDRFTSDQFEDITVLPGFKITPPPAKKKTNKKK